MATTPPLHGMRIIECSALGPAAITTALVDLGADVIKVEPPAGDYIREMTWPIVEGTSLMHLHLNRGKRSLVLDLRTEAGVAIFKELAAGADVVVEAMRPGSLARRGVGFDDLRAMNPKIVFCTISGYGMTGPYRDYPSHGIAYDTWAGIVKVATDEEGFTYIPEHVSIGINAGPAVRRSRHPRRRDPGPRRPERAPISTSPSPTRRRRWTGIAARRWRAYERPESEVTGQQGGRLRAARARARPAWSRASATRSTRRPTTSTSSSWPPSRPSGRTSARRSTACDLFERWPGSKYADHARGNRELQRELRAIFRTKTAAGVARVRRTGQHADRAGQHAQDVAGRPAVRRSLPAPAGRGSRRDQLFTPLHFVGRGSAAPGQGADRGPAHRGGLALRARLRRRSDRRRPRRRRIRSRRSRRSRRKGGT